MKIRRKKLKLRLRPEEKELRDLGINQVYGVQCTKRRGFGQACYPATGREIRLNSGSGLYPCAALGDFGIIRYFSPLDVPKGFEPIKIEEFDRTRVYIAARRWKHSDPLYVPGKVQLKMKGGSKQKVRLKNL